MSTIIQTVTKRTTWKPHNIVSNYSMFKDKEGDDQRTANLSASTWSKIALCFSALLLMCFCEGQEGKDLLSYSVHNLDSLLWCTLCILHLNLKEEKV